MAEMMIRRAQEQDVEQIGRLLLQVEEVHHSGRPDLFKGGARKYSDGELRVMLSDDDRPVFGAFDEDGVTLFGYAFCVFQRHPHDSILTDITTLYIDDLCVDESVRGRRVGTALYRHVIDFARAHGCHNVTLNVWSCNPGAQRFYERMGLKPYRVGMEQLL